MKTGFTWDTQDKEYDTAMAVETWSKAERSEEHTSELQSQA